MQDLPLITQAHSAAFPIKQSTHQEFGMLTQRLLLSQTHRAGLPTLPVRVTGFEYQLPSQWQFPAIVLGGRQQEGPLTHSSPADQVGDPDWSSPN